MTESYHVIQPPLFVFSKVCKHCIPPTEKSIEEFDRDRNKPDGRATMCKACAHDRYRKRYALLHPPKEQVELPPEEAAKRARQHESNRRYRLNNHEQELVRKRAYSAANRTHINERQNARYQEAVAEYRAKQPKVADGHKICATCHREMPLNEFYRSHAEPGGYRYSCKECIDRADKRRKNPGIRRNKPSVQPGYKWCYGCERELPVSSFSQDKRKWDGYRSKCNGCVAAWRKHYWQENRERLLPAQRIRLNYLYAMNAEQRRKHSERHKQPRYRLLAASALSRRRARIAQATTEEVDFRCIIERDGYFCYICNQTINPALRDGPARLTFDHVIPIARSGSHSEENIKPAHRACNQRKNAKLLSEMTPFQRRGPT